MDIDRLACLHSKIKTPGLGNSIPVLGMMLKRGNLGVMCILAIFQDRPVFSHII